MHGPAVSLTSASAWACNARSSSLLRSEIGLADANSTEFDPSTGGTLWIALMEEQQSVEDRGGTMRLGFTLRARLAGHVSLTEAYRTDHVSERHRHRYELNNNFRKAFHDRGLVATGTSPDGTIVEIMERLDHPWFLAVQFHPEFQSKPTEAHPLFRDFIAAALRRRNAK